MEDDYAMQIIDDLTSKLANLEKQNSMLFIENKKLKTEKIKKENKKEDKK